MTALPTDLIPVGKIIDAYHLRGQVKAYALSGEHDSLMRLAHKPPPDVWLKPASLGSLQRLKQHGLCLQDGLLATQVSKSTQHNGVVVLSLAHIVDRNLAEALKGAEILVSFASLPVLDSQEGYYWLDLIGCTVTQESGLPLGVVTGLLETGAHDILCIATTAEVQALGEAREMLIPFISQFVGDTNTKSKQIVVNWPLGHQ
ncbi:MAG: hypothetical protein RLZZ502_1395 [Pseudomonadota bacterium]|jgi:16S rRNA processing protein RimM